MVRHTSRLFRPSRMEQANNSPSSTVPVTDFPHLPSFGLYQSEFLVMPHPFQPSLSPHRFGSRAELFRVDQPFWFVHSRIPSSSADHVKPHARIHVPRASSVKAATFTQQYINVVGHTGPRYTLNSLNPKISQVSTLKPNRQCGVQPMLEE